MFGQGEIHHFEIRRNTRMNVDGVGRVEPAQPVAGSRGLLADGKTTYDLQRILRT